MAWTLEGYWIGPNEGVGYVFGPYSAPPPLLYIVARPNNQGAKLKTEPLSYENEGAPLGVPPLLNILTAVTNQSGTGTWFGFIGGTVA